MTANQLQYASIQETRRANREKEEETRRSNLEKEKETNRSNLAKEKETERANLAKEAETHRSNRENEGLRAAEGVTKLIDVWMKPFSQGVGGILK